jgi:hypothetical protein
MEVAIGPTCKQRAIDPVTSCARRRRFELPDVHDVVAFTPQKSDYKEIKMSASRLPLPLELTKPVLLAGDLDTLVRAGFDSSRYDPKTQLCSFADSSSTDQTCESWSENVLIDLSLDIVVIDDISL